MDSERSEIRLDRLAEALISVAVRQGAEQAEVLAVYGRALNVDVRSRALEHAEHAEGVEIGLRVLIGGRQACVSGSNHSENTFLEMAERAVAMAREAPVDEHLGLASQEQLARQPDPRDLQLADNLPDPAPEMLQDRAWRAEAAALAVAGISQVEAASASFSRRHLWLAATNGLSHGFERSSHSISTVAIAGEGLGMERDYAGEGRIWLDDLPEPEEIGALAASRTLARIGSKQPPTGSYPILYDPRVSSSLISHLLAAVNGTAIIRGASWLRNGLHEAVLPEHMSLTEDPHRPRFSASRLYDAEGLPTIRRDIVNDGILQGWTLDLATSRKLGMDSTASAARGIVSGPTPSNSNVILTPGNATQQQLITEMGRGLLVTSMLGASINPVTGDYSRGAAGFWVENGEIAFPVNTCTIAGNLREMLMTLQAGNDPLPWRNIEVPSLLVEGMTVAGA